MIEYKIEVKSWMRNPSTPDFDFMQRFNHDIPMPLVIMYTGGKVDETARMVKFSLHGDIKQRVTMQCMCCRRPITNKISQFFGLGPICGEHNYVNPFDTEEELNAAVASYRERLVNTKWIGWIPVSAILSINDISDPTEIRKIIADMPIEIIEDELPEITENESEVPEPTVKQTPKFVISARIDTPVKCTDDFSVFLSFPYNKDVVATVKELHTRFWNPDNKEWEIPYSCLAGLRETLADFDFDIQGEDKVPTPISVENLDYSYKTEPMTHQSYGVSYGLNHSRWLLADDQGLGKTKQIIDLAMIRKQNSDFKHCLIVCGVNGLKWNWTEEIQKHSDESGWILGQLARKRTGKVYIGSTKDKIADLNNLLNGEGDYPYFLITNIESLRNTEIADKLKELCDKKIIQMVAVDELHRCFDYDSPVLTDKGVVAIGDIVTNHLCLNVASYNNGNIEYQPITGWFENPVMTPLMELTIQTSNGIKTIKCTPEHKFYTNNRGWVCAKDLLDSDDILEINY